MKNIVICSRETDLKIGFLAFAAVAGFFAPVIDGNGWSPSGLTGSFMAVAVGIFVWAAFEMIKPSRSTHNWRRWEIAELWVVPTVWVLLMAAFAIWLRHFLAADENQMRSILEGAFPPVIAM